VLSWGINYHHDVIEFPAFGLVVRQDVCLTLESSYPYSPSASVLTQFVVHRALSLKRNNFAKRQSQMCSNAPAAFLIQKVTDCFHKRQYASREVGAGCEFSKQLAKASIICAEAINEFAMLSTCAFLGRTLEFQLEFIAMMAIAAFWAVRLDGPVRSLEGLRGTAVPHHMQLISSLCA